MPRTQKAGCGGSRSVVLSSVGERQTDRWIPGFTSLPVQTNQSASPRFQEGALSQNIKQMTPNKPHPWLHFQFARAYSPEHKPVHTSPSTSRKTAKQAVTESSHREAERFPLGNSCLYLCWLVQSRVCLSKFQVIDPSMALLIGDRTMMDTPDHKVLVPSKRNVGPGFNLWLLV